MSEPNPEPVEQEVIDFDTQVLKNEIMRLQIQRTTDKEKIAGLEETIVKMQGEPAPLVDKIFEVKIEGQNAAKIINKISKNGHAVIQLYGIQIVEIL